MSARQTFVLAHDTARNRAMAAVASAAAGWWVAIYPPAKKRAQEERYHAMIDDISKQTEHLGRKWDADDMKRLLVDEFAEQMRLAGTPLHHDSRVTVSLDGKRIVQLGIQTREFYVKEAADFIEFLFAWGADHDVTWSEPATQDTRAAA